MSGLSEHRSQLTQFQALFTGYSQAHGAFEIKETDPQTGKKKGNARTIRRGATLQEWEEHLAGGPKGLGTIPLLDDGVSVTFGVIDLDDNQIDHAQLELHVRELGLPLVVCRSKSGGAHCYLFLEKPCLAKEVVDALTNWAAALGYPGTEIFPKQTRRELEPDTGNPRPGNFINLPYFGGETTDRYCVFRGERLSLRQFLDVAESTRVGADALKIRHFTGTRDSEKPPTAKAREGRNGLLFSLGCRMRSQGSDERTIRTELTNVNTLADPERHENFRSGPLPDIELANIIKQVLRYESGQCLPDWAKGMNTQHAVVSEGGKTMILNTQDWDPAMKRHVLTRSTFADLRNFYCHINVVIGSDQAGNPIKIPKGNAWLKHPNRRQYSGVVFAPGKEMPGFFNMWRGFSIEPGAGDWSRMQRHIQQVICCGNSENHNYLIKWMAFTVQKPDEVPEVAVVLRGKRGTGKGILARELGFLFNEHFIHLNNPHHVTGNFNAHLQDSVLCLLDEAFWAGDKKSEGVLKTLITEPFIMIEGKYRNAVMTKNHLHIIIAGNEHWLVPAGMDERRFFVLDVSDERKQDTDYFAMLTHQMENGGREAMLHDLLTMDLTGFHPRSAPNTEALREQKLHSLAPLEAWWFERLWNGNVLPEDDDDVWTQEVPKESLYRGYLDHSGLASTRSHRGTETQVGIFLNKLLPDGWPSEGTMRKTIKEEGLDGEPVPKSKYVRSYMLPPLESCRETWDQNFNQTTDWPEIYEIPF